MLRALHALMTLVFLACVLVQYNDPDALLWMGAYGLALAVTALAALGKTPRRAAATLAAVYAIWALWLAPQVVGRVSVAELFDSMIMKTPQIELGRELGGLLIVISWMMLISLTTRPPQDGDSQRNG